VVTAAVDGKSVWYTIQQNSTDKTAVKTARFSEMHTLHKRLMKEVPSFPGRFPSKTWGKRGKTSPAFVENRRKDLELYLRLVASHRVSAISKAWLAFTGESNDGLTPIAESSARTTISSGEEEDSDSEDEGNYLLGASAKIGSFKSELTGNFSKQKGELSAVQEEHEELEASLAAGEEGMQEFEAEAKYRAGSEAEAAGHLHGHLLNLDALGANLANRKHVWSSKEHTQRDLAKLLEEKLLVASEATEAAEKRLEASRRVCTEAAAKNASKVSAAMAAQVEAETAHAESIEAHAAMTSAVTVLQERVTARMKELKAAETEFDVLTAAHKVHVTDAQQAEKLHCKAQDEAAAAVAALTSHKIDVTARRNANEVGVRRAEERVADLVALKDMHTRSLLAGDDRKSVEGIVDAVVLAADEAIEALAASKQLRDETEAIDAQKLESLQSAASEAAKVLKDREFVMVSLAARVEATKVQLHETSVKHSAAVAACKVANKHFEDVKKLFETTSEPLNESASRVDEAIKAVAAARTEGEAEQAALHHPVKADIRLLKDHQAEEVSIKEALDEARILAEQAHEDAAELHEAADKPEATIDSLVKKMEALCTTRKKEAKVAADAYKEALAAVAVSKEGKDMQLDDVSGSSLGESADSMESAKLKPAEAFVTGLKQTRAEELEDAAQESKIASEAAAAASAAAKQELSALQAQQRSTSEPIHSVEQLVREEVDLVNTALQTRKENEKIILEQAQQRRADWNQQEVQLNAELHRVGLEVQVAKQNVQASKDLAKTFLSSNFAYPSCQSSEIAPCHTEEQILKLTMDTILLSVR